MRLKIIIAIFILLITASCMPSDKEYLDQISDPPPSATAVEVTPVKPPSRPLTTTDSSLPNFTGPSLLIQTGINEYQLLNFGTNSAHAYPLPDSKLKNRFAENLSPSKSQLIFHVNDENIAIIDLSSGRIHKYYHLQSEGGLFNPGVAIQEARNFNPQLIKTDEMLLDAIKNALVQSKRNIGWYQSDRYTLTVREGSRSSTNLYLNDHQTHNYIQLEDAPGLVEAYWIGPNPEIILIKKGYEFEPGVWEDDRYYLIDIMSRTARSLPLPKDIKNPAVSWVTATTIGVIHQIQPIGGIGYSIIDINTMNITQLTADVFTHVAPLGDNYLILQPGINEYSTAVQVRGSNGLIRHKKEPDEWCNLGKIINDNIILNCEHESLAMDEQLKTQYFSDPIFSLTPSLGEERFILVTRPGDVSILDSTLRESQSIELAGAPIEVRWLPDATAFLYRTRGKLYLYDIASAESQLLIESDLFTDYTNINAVWVNIQ